MLYQNVRNVQHFGDIDILFKVTELFIDFSLWIGYLEKDVKWTLNVFSVNVSFQDPGQVQKWITLVIF